MIFWHVRTLGYYRLMLKQKNISGFSIIEVVIVLAIAGLIFVIVFMAVPALQRIQRDQHRKQDLATLTGIAFKKSIDSDAQLQQVSTTNFQNEEPTTGAPYTLIFHGVGASHDIALPDIGEIRYIEGHICENDSATPDRVADFATAPHGTKLFAVLMRLEASPDGFCLDNR